MADSKREQFIADALSSDIGECILWPFAVRKSSGYGAHSFRRAGKKGNLDAHRYVCELAHGQAPTRWYQAAHSCGNKLCINPRHLRWAFPTDNMTDAIEHGTLRGGGRYRQRFFEEHIADICTSGESLSRLAEKYGSDVPYIGRLKRLHAHRFAA